MRGEGQTREEATAEANRFRLAEGLETALEFDDEGALGERRFTRQERRDATESAATGLGEATSQVAVREPQGGGDQSVTQNNETTFNVTGDNPEETATRVRRLLTQLQGEQNVAALSALVPEAEPE